MSNYATATAVTAARAVVPPAHLAAEGSSDEGTIESIDEEVGGSAALACAAA